MINLELRDNQDGTMTLSHWDYEHGNDTIIRISTDGSAQELTFFEDADDLTEVWLPVDLVTKLFELCKVLP